MRLLAGATKRFPVRGAAIRLLNWLYPADRRQHDDSVNIVSEYHDRYIGTNVKNFLEYEIFFFGDYEPPTVSLLTRVLRSGMNAIDVGANVGSLTLVMADKVGPVGRVLAIEPFPIVAARLRENLALNRVMNVQVMEVALASRPGTASLHIPPSTWGNYGLAGLSPIDGLSNCSRIEVATRTLDEIIEEVGWKERLDFIKIDVEGQEMNVFRGGLSAFRRFRPHVLFEYQSELWKKAGFSFDNARDYFVELDYSLYISRPGFLQPLDIGVTPDSSNILAVPRMQTSI